MRRPILLFYAVILTACSTPSAQSVTERSAFVALVEGRTLASSSAAITISADGGLTVSLPNKASLVIGTWTWEGTQFCRTLSPGTGVEDVACQDVTRAGDVVTFDGPDGARSYLLR